HSPRGIVRAVLPPEQSAALRDNLITQLDKVTSTDVATSWAKAALSQKNTLSPADAELVERAFERRLSELSSKELSLASHALTGQDPTESENVAADHPSGIDKSKLTIPEPRRYRNREHLRYVARQACLLCGRKPSDAHHLRFAQPRALARKSSDEFAVP